MMIRIIDRKAYNPDEAEQLAEYAPITDRSDFDYLMETLYKDADGEYFLHAKGGAGTKYARKVSGGHGPGETIKRLSDEEALQWCEDREIDGEVALEEFGDLIENVE